MHLHTRPPPLLMCKAFWNNCFAPVPGGAAGSKHGRTFVSETTVGSHKGTFHRAIEGAGQAKRLTRLTTATPPRCSPARETGRSELPSSQSQAAEGELTPLELGGVRQLRGASGVSFSSELCPPHPTSSSGRGTRLPPGCTCHPEAARASEPALCLAALQSGTCPGVGAQQVLHKCPCKLVEHGLFGVLGPRVGRHNARNRRGMTGSFLFPSKEQSSSRITVLEIPCDRLKPWDTSWVTSVLLLSEL
ncbi:PREDICTED: uncharacterized protein LOC102018332 [Chinchilla lanigera]|uniref:uncharacterized protein LOC102018332 n=1 Tax=Chinchilla lanigera TaxID=34839 RepID=UPI000698125D|nr:PREDICTED: uncharacterized protein LOC102018332 [Chinchilla lanigera]